MPKPKPLPQLEMFPDMVHEDYIEDYPGIWPQCLPDSFFDEE